MVDVRAREVPADTTCPLCREARGAPVDASCAGCETRYHAACLAELGGCSTLGCSLKGVAVATARSLGCGVCDRLAAEPLTRRRCGCGATLHQGCVDAHAARCERGRRLQADAPGTARTTPADARAPQPTGSRDGFAPLRVAVLIQLAGAAFWGVALTWTSATETALLGAFFAYNVARVHALVAGLDWFEADDRRILLATAALFLPGLGLGVWWGSRWRHHQGL